ncbi:MAG: hypothetical protein ACI8P3_003636 [Saprospiraceae bacterium]|jgi:hypothetical protein
MTLFEDSIKKQQELWETTKFGVPLNYPIFHYDPSTPFDLVFKTSVEEVIEDIQFWDWEWDERERIIDSSGKVFNSVFETNGSMQAGVYPGLVERQMDLEEIKQMLEICLEVNKAIPNETIEVLLTSIKNTNSIKEIFEMCERYF